jgi:hypothetical protein
MGHGLGMKEHRPFAGANIESSFYGQSLKRPPRPAVWVLKRLNIEKAESASFGFICSGGLGLIHLFYNLSLVF